MHITVEDENEFEPEFTEGAYQATARENHMHISPPILQVGFAEVLRFIARTRTLPPDVNRILGRRDPFQKQNRRQPTRVPAHFSDEGSIDSERRL